MRKLSDKLEGFRCERPSEWTMDEYMQDARGLEEKIAEQATEIANLKTLAQAVVARHRRKIIIGDLSSYEMESEELENLAKALEDS